MKPLCFVLMPFGKKTDASGRTIDFDAVYRKLIEPAVSQAGMEPLRADEELGGGIIHKPMFERLLLCEYAVADMTSANANVFYELGVRHAVKPRATVLLYANKGPLPFDVRMLRAVPYQLGKGGGPAKVADTIKSLVEKLEQARGAQVDSPLYQLINDYPDVQHQKTDVFRAQVEYSKRVKDALLIARRKDAAAVAAVEDRVVDELTRAGGKGIADAEAGVLIDLLLSYRAVSAWNEMIGLYGRLPEHLKSAVMVREQYAFALNRAKQGLLAERVLMDLINERGPNSESCGILGRIYKDRWQAAVERGNLEEGEGLLGKAIRTYRQGFESDWRDAYPGINAVTLMECATPPDVARHELLPVVRYAVERRIANSHPDYWDHATLLELAILANDEPRSARHLADALANVREGWEPQTTLNNLRMIQNARSRRGEDCQWMSEIMVALSKAKVH